MLNCCRRLLAQPRSVLRSFSSNAGTTQLAGRRRFYKEVGIVTVDPPWIEASLSPLAHAPSPISAGIDGSPSGVIHHDHEITQESRKKNLDNNCQQWFGVTLDGRIVTTPLKSPLAVPSQHLAWMIAAEWDAQESLLKPAQMPLMTLVCTVLDQTAHAMPIYQQQALSYLPTDTLCYWVDPSEDRVLHRKQQHAWNHIHDYCEKLLGDKPAMVTSTTDWLKGGGALRHSQKLMQEATMLVHSLNAWELTALTSITSNCKSLLLGLAMVHSNNSSVVVTPAQASEASRLEEEFNIENWGLVEGGHDYDRLNSSIQLHAAEILLQCTRA